MDNKLEVKKMYKKYHNFTLGENSFNVPKGYITGFIGKNGMGKTTTIKSLLSLIQYQGEILLNGLPINDLNYLQDIGIVMDESFLSKDWTLHLVNKVMKYGYNHWDQTIFLII